MKNVPRDGGNTSACYMYVSMYSYYVCKDSGSTSLAISRAFFAPSKTLVVIRIMVARQEGASKWSFQGSQQQMLIIFRDSVVSTVIFSLLSDSISEQVTYTWLFHGVT